MMKGGAIWPTIVVGVVLSPLLFGWEPVGGDPDLLYRPIKEELARALQRGELPFWSDHFGLGVPLVAESHVAAFYPPNWVLFRICGISTAYRVSMWLHFLALAAVTYGYARELGISRTGSASTAIGFSLCGFQAAHSCHEPFYHVVAYLPLCLLLGNRFVKTGRPAWLAGLALAFGVQLTLGHFQIQMWTAALVLCSGAWTALRCRLPATRLLALALGLTWGAGIALVQLRLTWELTKVTGFDRAPQFLSIYLFPPSLLGQWVLPAMYLGRPLLGDDRSWAVLRTTPTEACAYIGVVPLILACAGLFAHRRDRVLSLWPWLALLALALASMAWWWNEGYNLLVRLPGLGWFRAPARYTLITSLGLLLLAGQGLDRSSPPLRFWGGIAAAVSLGAAAAVWTAWASTPPLQASHAGTTLVPRIVATGLAWSLGLAAIVAWRVCWTGAWAPLLVQTAELCGLFYLGPVSWGKSVDIPAQSPVLLRLAGEPDVGLVAGRALNLPARIGLAPAYPMMGITPPPPNYLLEPSSRPPGSTNRVDLRWQRRFGVSHGIWAEGDDVRGTTVIAEFADSALDRLLPESTAAPPGGRWKLVRYRDPFPAERVVFQASKARLGWGMVYATLSELDHADDAWFLPEDFPGPLPDPIAKSAKVVSWKGLGGLVEHDGSCILIVRRTYYPGWHYRVNDGPEQPVRSVDGGLQAVLLFGNGTSHVRLGYRPTGLVPSEAVSLVCLASALLVLAAALWRSRAGGLCRAGRGEVIQGTSERN
jgi:hypothetical protein